MKFRDIEQIYEQFENPCPIEKIFEFPIPFDPSWKNIAISLSGGADSALLCYLICDLVRKHKVDNFTVNVLSHVRCWKTKPWQEYDSENIFNWFDNKFQNIKFVRHVNYIPPELEWADKGPTIEVNNKIISGDILEIQSYAEYVCIKHSIEVYFNAVTKNPSIEFSNRMPWRDIKPNKDNHHLQIMLHMNKLVIHPFRFVDKSVILDLYKKINILDLFELTRSCEGEITDLNYTNYTPGQHVPTCGECFWCKEREWAIEQNK